ncbi:ketopantoate reductase family protein [Mycobacterium paraterrae]|uniref:2-dehydropantoate 2-reductase n=1 Tax=Mycobacterium paraterrae TaxID=577492 RepID=A0ABY3VJ28_9MYCO|nr:2-dehydropantoate 2-reductase N-terminal domain-containing protein [Mycobacterium paraterrae]UMB69420.1 2-dehydropantoate 2-reductase [Mycobacterium paraterrae]
MSSGRRYVIVGAGAIGGTVGGVLTRAGVATVLVARGPHAETLAANGLTLRTPDGTFQTPVAAVSDAAEVRLTPDDVLVFTTKTQQLDVALQQWVDQPVHGPEGVLGTAGELLPALTALNGVVAEDKSLRYFRRVYGVCVWLPAVHLTAGEVIVRSWPVVGQFHVGRWPVGLSSDSDDDVLQDVNAAWTSAGVRINVVDDIAPWKYNKLISNLGNAVGALASQDGDLGRIVAALQAEAEAVLRDAGIDFVSFEVSTAARVDGPTPRPVPGVDTGAGNSTWQSLSRNTGDVETDYFNGEIVRIAHQHGIAAPLNSTVARLARETVRTHAGPGQYSAAQLADLLGLK